MNDPKAQFISGGIIHDEGVHAIFPLLTIKNGIYSFVATAFFIAKNGIFCTAKHAVYDKKGNIENDLHAAFFFENNEFFIRKITTINNAAKSDIVLGILEPIYDKEDNFITNKVMTLSSQRIKTGDFVATYAYPKSTFTLENGTTTLNFNTSWHFGKVTDEFPNGRDSFLMPGACYQTTIQILGGASGGPVGNAAGQICAVNSTGYDIEEGSEDISYITPITEIFDLRLEDNDGVYTILELSKMNVVDIK